jgi:hypothetical protein
VYGSFGTKGSGFRLPWSHKKTKHSDCKGLGCGSCDNGKIIEGEYLPAFVYKDEKMEYVSETPTVETLMMATVRTQVTNVTEIPELVIICRPVKKEGDFTASETKNELVNSELSALLETFIRKNMPGQENTRLQNIFYFKTCHLLKTTSRYCENIKREHNSNHIKLRIDSGGIIYQQCFCRCETVNGRFHGLCKNFSGRKHQLNSKICSILYPKKHT